MGQFALNVLPQSDAKLYRAPKVEGSKGIYSAQRASSRPSEGKPASQLKLARGAGGGQDLADIIGETTRRIFEDGIPITSQDKRALCVARHTEIRMVEQVIGFHSNRDLSFVNDGEILLQRWVKLRKARPPQHISSGIA